MPGRLASAVRSWGDDVARYKGREKYGDVLLEYLDRRNGEQVEGGLEVEREEEVRWFRSLRQVSLGHWVVAGAPPPMCPYFFL